MFGFVTADAEKLSQEQKETYRAFYCGVCRSLKTRHGTACELALSYDMVFLAMLLMSVYREEPEEHFTRCVPHPGKRHRFYKSELIDYAADMGLILMYYKLLDDWTDDRDPVRYAGSRVILRKARRTEKKWPRQAEKIKQCLKDLSEAEKRDERQIDVPVRMFGALMGELFVYREDEFSPLLWETGRCLGMYVYLCDAALDLKEDLKKKHYNPLAGYGSDGAYDSLCAVMGQCCAVYRQLPVDKNKGILDNILYSGVWGRWNLAHAPRKQGKNDPGKCSGRKDRQPEGGPDR